MRKLLLLMLIAVGLPASAATIKFFTDYPNSVPIGSDFFVLQRNTSYINASRDQVKADWFNNPVFGGIIYGNGIGITNVNASGTNADFTYITNFTVYSTNIQVQNINVTSNITVQTVITTNVFTTNLTSQIITNNTFVTTNVTIQFPGGVTNLNLTPNTVMYADVNDAEASIPNAIGVLTNNGVGGIGFSSTLQLDELDVQNGYITNFFTGLTNFSVLGTDANGLLTLGSSTTNFITSNLFFVSGKGNTLVITNNLNLLYLTASKLMSTDGAKNATNADVSADLSFSGNVLGIAAGAHPILNLWSSTNLPVAAVVSPTNGVSTASSIDFTIQEAVTNIAGAVSQTSVANFNQTNINHAIRYYVNRTGSDQTITVGTWETDSGRTSATTYTCTNNTTLALMFSMYTGQFTNVTSYKTFR